MRMATCTRSERKQLYAEQRWRRSFLYDAHFIILSPYAKIFAKTLHFRSLYSFVCLLLIIIILCHTHVYV